MDMLLRAAVINVIQEQFTAGRPNLVFSIDILLKCHLEHFGKDRNNCQCTGPPKRIQLYRSL